MPKKVILTVRLLKHRSKSSAVLVSDANVIAGKLDAIFCIVLLLFDETSI